MKKQRKESMKKIIVGIIALIITSSTFASNLPGWVKSTSENLAFNTLVEWMQGGPFYKITNVEISDFKDSSNQEGIKVIIQFDDSVGCNERTLEAQCIPTSDDEILCLMLLSDCLPDGGRSLKKSFSLKK